MQQSLLHSDWPVLLRLPVDFKKHIMRMSWCAATRGKENANLFSFSLLKTENIGIFFQLLNNF